MEESCSLNPIFPVILRKKPKPDHGVIWDYFNLCLILTFAGFEIHAQDAEAILRQVDRNMSSSNRIFESSMTIHGRRTSRTITSRTYSVGDKQSFTEYLSPSKEQGTKMLKLENQLWIYSPSTDRTMQISGHMLRQSVMGSDLSYEDMMDDRKLTDVYEAKIAGTEIIDGRETWKLKLVAKVSNVNYYSQKFGLIKNVLFP